MGTKVWQCQQMNFVRINWLKWLMCTTIESHHSFLLLFPSFPEEFSPKVLSGVKQGWWPWQVVLCVRGSLEKARGA